jgi:hypothetical protein
MISFIFSARTTRQPALLWGRGGPVGAAFTAGRSRGARTLAQHLYRGYLDYDHAAPRSPLRNAPCRTIRWPSS